MRSGRTPLTRVEAARHGPKLTVSNLDPRTLIVRLLRSAGARGVSGSSPERPPGLKGASSCSTKNNAFFLRELSGVHNLLRPHT